MLSLFVSKSWFILETDSGRINKICCWFIQKNRLIRSFSMSSPLCLCVRPFFPSFFTHDLNNTFSTARVKVFNMRFRSRHLIGDEKFVVPFDGKASETVDPRGSIGFVELDQICTTFLSTFPPLMKNPVDNNTVDRHLYSAHLIAHMYVSCVRNIEIWFTEEFLLELRLCFMSLMRKYGNPGAYLHSRFLPLREPFWI